MANEQKELGVLFVDISDSSHLFQAYGNEGARDIVRRCLEILREVVLAGEGRVIERIGDELLTVFPNPDSSLCGAVELQKAVARARNRSLPTFLAVRIGMHYGPVMDEGDSVFGDTIYTASRVAALAKGNQILTTGATVARLSPLLRPRASFVEERTLRGTHHVHDIYRISWDDPDLTDVPRQESAPDEAEEAAERAIQYSAVELSFKDQKIIVSPSNPACLIGRSQRCDIHLGDGDVSRVHTRVEYRSGHYYVVDMSSNGTTVRLNDGEEALLQEEERRLHGSGSILPRRSEVAKVLFTCIPALADNTDRAEADPVSSSRTPRTG